MIVYVLNKHGRKLMPCSPRRARLLLKEGKAKVIKRTPFTIQLIYGSTGYVQPVKAGVDKGSKVTGIACIGNGKLLFSGHINHRLDIKKKMESRASNRRARRSRLWYREPRFLNRSSSKRSGRIPPSIKANIEEVLRTINKIPLPITEVIVEDVQIDIAKLNNPELKGRDYQESNRLDENLRMATLIRDNMTCQVCKKRGCKLEAHHIIPRSEGGKDTIKNLITLCGDICHKQVHKGKLKITGGVSGFKDRMAQRTMQGKAYLYEKLKESFILSTVFGYQTAQYRKEIELPKDHDIDALCVATLQSREMVQFNKDNFYNINFRAKQTRRQYHDMPKKGTGRVKYQVNQTLDGFKKGDIVLVKGFLKQINSIYSNRLLAFKRIKGEPSSAMSKQCKIVESQPTIVFSTT